MSVERGKSVLSGWPMLGVVSLLVLGGTAAWIVSIPLGLADGGQAPVVWLLVAGFVVSGLGFLLLPGFFALQPNEARVIVLFGRYLGSVRAEGFHWGNPFYSNGSTVAVPARTGEQAATKRPRSGSARFKVSLRARTLLGERLKVNDRRGNPVEIAAMVVWRVTDTAQAVFDVDDYETYVVTQAETALRHVATAYAYDHGADSSDDEGGPAPEVTLRGNPDEVSAALRADLGTRLAVAGVVVEDARLTHLAYAPEIAQAMLRRQQAEAVIAARRKIVTGAVSMVDMALTELSERRVVELDSERKAAMVSNLMVVLCGEADVTPVLNAGTLYQ